MLACRIPINNKSNEKKINNAQGTNAMSINEKLGNVAEIVLISPDGYGKPINDFRKLDVLEFLVRLAILCEYSILEIDTCRYFSL